MGTLDRVSVSALRSALETVNKKKPTQRLMIAIAYKHGVSQTELADWYDIERKTVYNWLSRLEARPEALADAARDASRPGRPRKLTPSQQAALERTLSEPPTEAGYDAPGWTPELLRRQLRERFDCSYSIGSCRRLLREAGLEYDRREGYYTVSSRPSDESSE